MRGMALRRLHFIAFISLFAFSLYIMFTWANLRQMAPFFSQSRTLPDLLTVDAKTLASGLTNGHFTSVDLVEKSLEMIQKHDKYLHAMLSMVPRDQLRQRAEVLDKERKEGKIRGRLHGIPIVIKV
jgi:hypothetical protein